MEHSYTYIGCFIDREKLYESIAAIERTPLYRIIGNTHITFAYRPETVDETLFGEEVRVRIVGYGNNGKNEGLKVEIASDNEKIQSLAEKIPVPHITLSVSEDGDTADTRYLEFEAVEPIEITGVFGGKTEEETVNTKKR